MHTKAFEKDAWLRWWMWYFLLQAICNMQGNLFHSVQHLDKTFYQDETHLFFYSFDILFFSLWKSGSSSTETCCLQVAFLSLQQQANGHPLLVASHLMCMQQTRPTSTFNLNHKIPMLYARQVRPWVCILCSGWKQRKPQKKQNKTKNQKSNSLE